MVCNVFVSVKECLSDDQRLRRGNVLRQEKELHERQGGLEARSGGKACRTNSNFMQFKVILDLFTGL